MIQDAKKTALGAATAVGLYTLLMLVAVELIQEHVLSDLRNMRRMSDLLDVAMFVCALFGAYVGMGFVNRTRQSFSGKVLLAVLLSLPLLFLATDINPLDLDSLTQKQWFKLGYVALALVVGGFFGLRFNRLKSL